MIFQVWKSYNCLKKYDYLYAANLLAATIICNVLIDSATPVQIGMSCLPKQEGELEPNPDDCSSFLICDNDRYYRLMCPQSLHYDPKRKVCNFKDQVSFKKPIFISFSPLI